MCLGWEGARGEVIFMRVALILDKQIKHKLKFDKMNKGTYLFTILLKLPNLILWVGEGVCIQRRETVAQCVLLCM